MGEESIEVMRALLRTQPKALFSCIRLSFQNYVEVEPNFHKEHIGELSEDWVLMNTSGTSHKLKYNRTMSFPLITEGLETLALFEGFPENVEVVFGHFGGRIFAVVAFHEIGSLDDMSAFHSRSLLPMKTDWFDIILQVINDSFAEYVREKRLSYVSLCADDGRTYGLKVVLTRDPYRTKLGRNWSSLCDVLNFKVGDVIRFMFGLDNRCYLYKIA
ncbi:hypothetical protein P8452_38406 [Trifolium repens]|nr:hypothetical protein P8452_38406 [Trifolium repens]